MKKNITVVGCGYWGKNLVRNFSELGALYSICDPNTEIANKYAGQYNVKNSSFIEIINDLNITIINSTHNPDELHSYDYHIKTDRLKNEKFITNE